MEKMKMNYRVIEKKDYDALAKIISETWKYEKYCSKVTATRMAHLFLYNCLTQQSFTEVVEIDGEAMGVVMAKSDSKYQPSFKYIVKKYWQMLVLFSYKEGRTIMKMFKHIDSIDNKLLDETNENFDGELSFFVLNEKTRGLGIGKRLFYDAVNYMKTTGVEQFYLYTDSSCNYGFYEKQGLKRINEISVNLDKKDHEKVNFFLYKYIV